MKHYTWKQYQKDIDFLTAKLSENPSYVFDGIYGIARGGLVVANSLSHSLNLPLKEKSEVTATTLVVDDIVDTGETMARLVYSLGLMPFFATIFYNSKSKVTPHEYVRKKTKEILLPWEV